jgi:hypothetical protein
VEREAEGVKKKPRPRTRKPGAYADFEDARDELRRHGPRARWALDELERMAKGKSEYGTLPPALAILCLKEILAYEGLPKALQFKAAEGVAGDTSITIQVAGWAAATPSRQLPAPEPIDVTNDPGAHRTNSTPPSPELDDLRRDRERLAAAATPPTPIYEVSPRPDVPKRVIGEASPARGLSMQERLKRGGFISTGERRETPDTQVESTFNLFGKQ